MLQELVPKTVQNQSLKAGHIDFPVQVTYRVVQSQHRMTSPTSMDESTPSVLNIMTDEVLEPGTLIEVQFKLTHHSDHLYLVGKVAHQNVIIEGKNARYVTKVSFEHLNVKFKEELCSFMFKKIHEAIQMTL